MNHTISAEAIINVYKERLAQTTHELILLKAVIEDLQKQNEVLKQRLKEEVDKKESENR
jgi:cell division protein FtsB